MNSISLSGFYFNRLVVIQSLEDHETQTGKILHDFLTPRLPEGCDIEFQPCESAIGFTAIIERLIAETAGGVLPIVHIETHGDKTTGLEFANGSMLSWDELSSSLSRLNIATGFNFMVTCAACFGMFLMSKMNMNRSAVCYCILAPTDLVDPSELLGGFREFYVTFFGCMDAGKASSAMQSQKLQNGAWFGKAADAWYEQMIVAYAEKAADPELHAENLTIIAAGLGQSSQHSREDIERYLRTKQRMFLNEEAFHTFFCTNDLPANIERFDTTRRNAALQLQLLGLEI
jgi:hypothetical protein